MKNEIGRRIKKYRKEAEYTQETFAEKVELSTSFIAGIEKGKKLPSILSLIKMAEVLDVSADVLLGIEREGEILSKTKHMDQRLRSYPVEVQEKIFDVIDVMMKYEKEQVK